MVAKSINEKCPGFATWLCHSLIFCEIIAVPVIGRTRCTSLNQELKIVHSSWAAILVLAEKLCYSATPLG